MFVFLFRIFQQVQKSRRLEFRPWLLKMNRSVARDTVLELRGERHSVCQTTTLIQN